MTCCCGDWLRTTIQATSLQVLELKSKTRNVLPVFRIRRKSFAMTCHITLLLLATSYRGKSSEKIVQCGTSFSAEASTFLSPFGLLSSTVSSCTACSSNMEVKQISPFHIQRLRPSLLIRVSNHVNDFTIRIFTISIKSAGQWPYEVSLVFLCLYITETRLLKQSNNKSIAYR